MYLGHGSWVALVLFAGMFAMRYFSSQRRRGQNRGPGPRSSFTGSDRPGPPRAPGTEPTPGTGDKASGTAPGWFRDPFFKHEHRYWSGDEWTEHVSDGDVPGIDPPPSESVGPGRG